MPASSHTGPAVRDPDRGCGIPARWFQIGRTATTGGRVSEEAMVQSIETALALAQRVYVMSKGQVVFRGSARDLASNDEVRRQYLEV